jgi:hypothetical protein
LELAADQMMPGLTDELAGPSLRAHLLLLAAHGKDPATQLAAAAGSRELASADDRAAVLEWRLDNTNHPIAGPLPWLAGIPTRLHDDPIWGHYLTARSELVAALANQVKATVVDTGLPDWATQRRTIVPRQVVAEVQVWQPPCKLALGSGVPPALCNCRKPPAPGSTTSTDWWPVNRNPLCRNGASCSTRSIPT